jgi:outer membrane biosynthesis protein TonB
MKLIRWLLSNIILIAFILALTYAYVYWDNLTGSDTPAGKVIAVLTDEFDSVREFVESYQPDTDVAEQGAVATTKVETVEQQALATEPVAPPAPQPLAPTPARQPEPQASIPPAPPARQPAPQATIPPAPPAHQPTQQASIPPSQPVAPASLATATRADTTKTERQLWIEARTAFQKGQYEESIGLYKDIVAANSDSFDAWGEMGNVYMRTGDIRQASAAYYEAAAIMVRLGQRARARSVLPLLHRLDRDKARQLNELILKPTDRSGV